MSILKLFKVTFDEWKEDRSSMLSAAFAYYALFALAPVLVIAIALAGLVLGDEAAKGEIVNSTQEFLGRDGAEAIETMIENARQQENSGILATILSVLTLILGATGLFQQLQKSLNLIWEVEAKPAGGMFNLDFLKRRLLSLLLVIMVGVFLLALVVINSVLPLLYELVDDLPASEAFSQLVSIGVNILLLTGMFAVIYKVLPDVKIRWNDVVMGAAVTAILLTIGNVLIGVYLGRSSVGSTYGAAGSFIVLIVWLYYTSQVMYFGAEFTQVYANMYGAGIVPDKHAIRIGTQPPKDEATKAAEGDPFNQDTPPGTAAPAQQEAQQQKPPLWKRFLPGFLRRRSA